MRPHFELVISTWQEVRDWIALSIAAGAAAAQWRRAAGAGTTLQGRLTQRMRTVRSARHNAKPMATPGKHSDGEAVSFPALSNTELGAIFADTARSYAVRRTGSSRDFWRKLLDEPDMILVLGEFKRRAMERQEEYDAWLQLQTAGGL